MTDTITKIKTAELADAIKAKLSSISKQIMRWYETPYKADGSLYTEWDFDSYTVFFTNNDVEYTIVYSADVDVDDYEYEAIVDFKNIKVESVDIDGDEVEIDDPTPLLELTEELIDNAQYYKFVDDETYLTTDKKGAYNSMIESYQSNQRDTMQSLGLTNSDFLYS